MRTPIWTSPTEQAADSDTLDRFGRPVPARFAAYRSRGASVRVVYETLDDDESGVTSRTRIATAASIEDAVRIVVTDWRPGLLLNG